ncbi:hypothetical protein K402DRAFT_402920 [Aulographum hederae CBS 113979]|uniref:Uncharacterized protein n=1 Tax=Aulographum hederae CBS 113979 TaxID=1176131 RepID=A0A6G1H581_9PEZI|nr:hypothetical protein K402DRAFT_402920 [Aulographum hederae CBS 113979]
MAQSAHAAGSGEEDFLFRDRGDGISRVERSLSRHAVAIAASLFLVLTFFLLLFSQAALLSTVSKLSNSLDFPSHYASSFQSLHSHFPEKSDPPLHKPLRFLRQPALEDSSARGDAAWTALLAPVGDGQIWRTYNETYKLPWGVSMYHGVDCLGMLRGRLLHGTASYDGGVLKAQGSERERDHVVHCLSYILQKVLCAGDSTIEPPWTRTDVRGNILMADVDGEGFEHMCKDTSQMQALTMAAQRDGGAGGELGKWHWRAGDNVESIFG